MSFKNKKMPAQCYGDNISLIRELWKIIKSYYSNTQKAFTAQWLYMIISFLLLPCFASGQENSSRVEITFLQQDIKDWIAKLRSKPPKPEKGSFLLIVPFISSNPTAGFIVGAGLTYTFKASKNDQYLSLISSAASYSTKGLVSVNFKTNAYIFHERLFLNGDWRYLVNGETTYGLGTAKTNKSILDINGYPTSTDSLAQPLKYHQLRFYEIGSWKVFKYFYAGVGFQYDRYYDIIDDRLEKGDTGASFHYQYSINHHFDPKDYTVSGVSLNLLFDSRDNQVNAYRGQYANVNYLFNLTGLGSTQNSNILLTEYRCFLPLDRRKQRHILGFWLYGSFVTYGTAPYLALPALGYDKQQRTGRGYTFGQFRGQDLLYGETEYRFPISKNTGILGGVAFLNATTTSDQENNVKVMDYLRLGYGAGLRIMLDKTSRTRLDIDAGLSPHSFGFYLAATETF
jgi:outer membrane protein assembly factor BamA